MLLRTKLAILTAAFAGVVFAQDTTRVQPGTLPGDGGEASRTVPGVSSSNPSPMTRGEKYRYRLRHTFNGWDFVRANLGASLDHWRDYPEEWGQGWDAYGVRLASTFGQHLIKEQIMGAVEIADHEDPRRPHSQSTTLKGCVLDAVKYAFMARSDSGRLMPAYSRYVGAYGAAFISRYAWYPAEFHNAATPLKAGTTTLGIDTGMNVLRGVWQHYRHP